MKVAVYGTLREGEGNHRVMNVARGELVGTTRLSGYVMHSLHGGFPGVKRGEGTVVVEVYELPDVRALDYLEGYNEKHPENGLYDRHITNTEFGDAWIYTYNGLAFGNVIEDWKEKQ